MSYWADYSFPNESLFKFSSIIRSPNHRYLGGRNVQKPTFRQNRKWEITMRKTILTVVSASVIAALTAQTAAAASEHHRTRMHGHAVATQQFRNSNAYAAPSETAAQSYWSSLDEGAMASGMAGH
jgi:hypothetical protein